VNSTTVSTIWWISRRCITFSIPLSMAGGQVLRKLKFCCCLFATSNGARFVVSRLYECPSSDDKAPLCVISSLAKQRALLDPAFCHGFEHGCCVFY
jgi:hypothetical protein